VPIPEKDKDLTARNSDLALGINPVPSLPDINKTAEQEVIMNKDNFFMIAFYGIALLNAGLIGYAIIG